MSGLLGLGWDVVRFGAERRGGRARGLDLYLIFFLFAVVVEGFKCYTEVRVGRSCGC